MNNETLMELADMTMGCLVTLLIIYAVFRFFVGYPPAAGQCSCGADGPKKASRRDLAEQATAYGITVRDTDKRGDLERKLNIYRDRAAALDVPEPPLAAVSLEKTAGRPKLEAGASA